MNKQEAIDKIRNISTLKINDRVSHHEIDMVIKNQVLDIISQIDEPKKVVVPQFVAEYIEYCKHEKFYALHGAYNNMDDRLKCWRFKGNNIELFAKAWLYGYEVEKEKLYTVELPNPNSGGHVVLCKTGDGRVAITSEDNENTKFEFWLPRNTKNKKLNMVINSNDRDHNKVTGHMVSRIRKLAAYETKAKKDKYMLPFSPKRPCHLTVTVYKPTRRRLDTPNLYPTVKPLVDGMTEAGIWTDDNDNVIKSTKFQLGGLSGKKGYYRFVLTIEEVSK